VVTSDGQYRRGAAVPVKVVPADAAVVGIDSHRARACRASHRKRNGKADIPWTPGRDVWWHDTVADDVPPRMFTFQNTLMPKRHSPIMCTRHHGHTVLGSCIRERWPPYHHASWTHRAVFDAKDTDVYCARPTSLKVTAHTYVLWLSVSSNGVDSLSSLCEGTPTRLTGRDIPRSFERYGVTTYYTARPWFGPS
jgi:acetyl-CoA synthetase